MNSHLYGQLTYDKGSKNIQWGKDGLTPHIKINSKWIKDQNVRPETIKLLEENTGSLLFDISLSNNVLTMSSQARKTKAKINKCDYIKLKSFCTGNGTININTMKRPPTKWGG